MATETVPNSLLAFIHQLTDGDYVPLPNGEHWKDMIQRISVEQQIAEVDKQTYWYFLEVLPPRFMNSRCFCFAEGFEPFRMFWERDGKFFCRRLTWDETKAFCRLARCRLYD